MEWVSHYCDSHCNQLIPFPLSGFSDTSEWEFLKYVHLSYLVDVRNRNGLLKVRSLVVVTGEGMILPVEGANEVRFARERVTWEIKLKRDYKNQFDCHQNLIPPPGGIGFFSSQVMRLKLLGMGSHNYAHLCLS